MDQENINQPATKGDLQALREELSGVVEDAVEKVVEGHYSRLGSKLEGWQDEILKSNDKVAQEYKTFETEKAGLQANYKKLDKRTEKVEDFAERAADKLQDDFKRA
jgi:hypothetical protein